MDQESSASSGVFVSSAASRAAYLAHLHDRVTAAQEDIAALRLSLSEAQAGLAELRQGHRQVHTRLLWLERLFGALRRALQIFLGTPHPQELV